MLHPLVTVIAPNTRAATASSASEARRGGGAAGSARAREGSGKRREEHRRGADAPAPAEHGPGGEKGGGSEAGHQRDSEIEHEGGLDGQRLADRSDRTVAEGRVDWRRATEPGA